VSPKNDLAKEIAQAIFSQNPEAIYNAMARALFKGNPHVFKELAERAYGKIPARVELVHDDEVVQRLLAGRKRAREANHHSRPAL